MRWPQTVVFFVVIALSLGACDGFPRKTTAKIEPVVIDTLTVDRSPAFESCKDLLGTKRARCFGETLKNHMESVIKRVDFTVKQDLDAALDIYLLIQATGVVELDKVEASMDLADSLPQLDSIIEVAIRELPVVIPATKRGIPVKIQYRQPIFISTKIEE